MRFLVMRTVLHMMRAQLLGDYLLTWIAGSSEIDYGVTKLYVITRKHGSTRYSLIMIIYHIGCGIDDAGSSGKILRGSTELSIFRYQTMSLPSYSLTRRELSYAKYPTCKTKEKKVQ